MEDLAVALKQARETAGMSQGDLAERLGVREKTISRWETGRFSPRGRNLDRIREQFPELASATAIEQLRAEVAALSERIEQLERHGSQDA